MLKKILVLAVLLNLASLVAQTLDTYNVVWTSQSKNSSESMPCGGGDIGLNVWVEKGELLIYLSRSGSFDELNGNPKLGRVRVTLSPNPFSEGSHFRQELKMREGCVEISGEKDGLKAKVAVWVDVHSPVVHINIDANKATSVTAAYEAWRLAEREILGRELDSNRAYVGAPERAIQKPDQVDFTDNSVRFVHRNQGRTAFDMTVTQQELDGVKGSLWNPLTNLTYGGALYGKDFIPVGTGEGRYASTPFKSWLLRSKTPSLSHELTAVLHVATTPSLAEWDAGLSDIMRKAAVNPREDQRETQAWWKAFWDRSHVFINADKAAPASPIWQIGRNYQVFRYQLGCNATGDYPTKFNGGPFTFDPEYVDPARPYTADYRAWGGGSFTAQNQRLVYWPMLKSGDFDLMKPQFEFYRRALVNAEARSQVYWGIKGASFTEQIENYGLPLAFEYTWKRNPAAERGVEDNLWISYEWDTSFEFCQMILDTHRYTGADIRKYLPLIESCLSFYDEYYQKQETKRSGRPLSADDKLVLFPATACETYKEALNPSNTIAALRSVLRSLVALPEDQISRERLGRWRTMLGRIPALAFRDREGHRTISPAWKWSRIQNVELPQLYPVYPWGLYGIGRPDLDVAINTWSFGADNADQKQIISWHQDAIFCARLGLTEEAAALTIQKMQDSGRRFPTWWGPGHDWVPDHNWGGSGMVGVQEMLLQAVDDKIYLLPAWPKTWDVDFKLHAPGNTTVEVVFKSGKIQTLRVTPTSRAKDVVMPKLD